MTDARTRLPYWFHRAALYAWEQTGRCAYVHTKRNGGLSISLSGSRRITVHDAMRKIESHLDREPAMREALRAYRE